MKLDTNHLRELGNDTLTKRIPVLNLWQILAEHFYPERADFTITRNVGAELAEYLVDSYPVLIRRDLANSFSSMLRDGEWFRMGVDAPVDHAGQQWLEWASDRMRKLMYRREANFIRSTKEGDHDYATFGQCVISVEMNRSYNGALYRAWHLRDCAWWDDEAGQVSGVVRRWKIGYRQAVNYFGESKLHSDVVTNVHLTPFKELAVLHMVIPSNMYGDDRIAARFKYVSLFLDTSHHHLIEEVGLHNQPYLIPRFQTVAGSPYAYSPATVVGLPDARTLQAMTHTLLEVAERTARPPVIATLKAVRGDVDLSADGVTWVDKEYDERMGAALRQLDTSGHSVHFGDKMRDGIMGVLSSAFYLNKISLPETGREMTAFEVSERMKQFRRENLPLFAPIEAEYSGQLCELTFDVLMRANLLGSPADIPQSLRGRNIIFKFESPLSKAEEEEKANKFRITAELLGLASQMDQGVAAEVDFRTAIRDAIKGATGIESWLRDPDEAAEAREAGQMARAMADQQAAAQ